MVQSATNDFAAMQTNATASGFVPGFVPETRNDPVVGIREREVFEGPPMYGATRTYEDRVKQSDYYAEFAALEQEEQEAYAEAMFAAGWAGNLEVETIDEIYQPYVIQGMLETGLERAANSMLIGRSDLPDWEQALAGAEETSLQDALAKLDGEKPEIRYMDRAGLEETADAYFNRYLGRKGTSAELSSFVAGIHAAQKAGLKGAEIDVGGRALEFARGADPRRAEGMEYSRAASSAMKALGMSF